MRLNDRFNVRESVLIISVLASPGTPSSRQWPRLKREISSSSITSRCPTITLDNWPTIFSRASPNLRMAVESKGTASDGSLSMQMSLSCWGRRISWFP